MDRDGLTWEDVRSKMTMFQHVPCFNVACCHHTQDITDFPFNLWPKFGVWVQELSLASFIFHRVFFVCFRCAMKTWYLKWFLKSTFPETGNSLLKIGHPKMETRIPTIIFRGKMLFSGSVWPYQSLSIFRFGGLSDDLRRTNWYPIRTSLSFLYQGLERPFLEWIEV